MNDREQDKVIAFDTLFTNHHIQMMKILMPYFDRPMQKNLAVYIKYMELQYTLNFFKQYPNASPAPLPREASFDIMKLCSDMMPYCSPQEKARMENMRNMYQTFENYKGMMEMVQMMKELFPEGDGQDGTGFGGLSPEMLSGLAGMGGMPGMDGMPDLSGMSHMGGMPGAGGQDGTQGFDPSQLFEMFQMMSGMSGQSDSGGDVNGSENEPSGMDGG